MLRNQRRWVVVLGVATAFLSSASLCLWAGEDDLQKLLHVVNSTTGKDVIEAQQRDLLKSPDAKKLIQFAVGLVKKDKKALSYNGALILAEVARAKKQYAASEEFYRVCTTAAAELESTQKLEEAYFGLIEVLFEAKKYKKSEEVCREIMELVTGPNKARVVVSYSFNPLVPVNISPDQFFPKKEDPFDSPKDLRKPAQRLLIKSVAKQGKFEEALKMAEKMAAENNDLFTQENLAWVLREAGKLNEAIKAYDELLNTAVNAKGIPEKVRSKLEDHYRYILSNLFVDTKQVPKAAEQLRILINHNPDEPGYMNDLGFIWADHDMNLDEAEKMIRKAIELDKKKRKDNPEAGDGDNGAYLDSLGWVLFKQKKFQEAKDWLLKAIKDENAQHIEIYDHLGDVLIALGETDAALKYWMTGVDLAGESRRDQDRKTRVLEKIKKNSKE